jgi:CheY-like chemotaxis protein
MMLTSDDCNVSVSKVKQLGIAAHLVKPIRQGELITAIRQIVGIAAPARNEQEILRPMLQGSIEQLRILLAEDNPVNQKLAMRLLERMGHTVTVAADGRQALEYFEGHQFDLILMDVQMPGMDGLIATQKIRESEVLLGSRIPIIAMTAHALEGDRDRCLNAGMDEYLPKPINGEKLAQTIKRCLDTVGSAVRTASPSTV